MEEVAKGATLHIVQGFVYKNFHNQTEAEGITIACPLKGQPLIIPQSNRFTPSLESETFYINEIHSTTNAHVIQIGEDYVNYYNNTQLYPNETKQTVTTIIPTTNYFIRCFTS